MPLSDFWESAPGLEDAHDRNNVNEDEARLSDALRKLQTSSARAAKAVKNERSEPAAAISLISQDTDTSFKQRLQDQHLRHGFAHASSRHSSYRQWARERARCVKSLLEALCAAVTQLFQSQSVSGSHVMNVVVADDTSTRMRPHTAKQRSVCTIMNTCQSLHMSFPDGRREVLNVPTPAETLTSGQASCIYDAFKSWLLVSAAGVGERWLSIGCPSNVADDPRWRTLVFVGDSLKANDAAWKHEKHRLQAGREAGNELAHRTLGLRFRCANHQLALTRKPVILSMGQYWPTLVRLGHLYEVSSFQRGVAGALISLVKKPGQFQRVVAFAAPTNESWKRRSAWIQRKFQSRSKGTLKAVENLLAFCNADTRTDVVTHCCVTQVDGQPCCQSEQDALCKFLSLVVPVFAKGYPTPLLYRFKHYGPASSFVKLGCTLHNLLPRALQELVQMKEADMDSDLARYVDVFLHEKPGSADVNALGLEELENALAAAVDTDRNFALHNGVRRRKVASEMNQASFCETCLLVDALIQPIEHAGNVLFGHSDMLHKINFLGTGHPDWVALCDKARQCFFHIVSGDLGRELLREYMHLWLRGLGEEADELGCGATAAAQKLFASLVVFCSDIHRRFIHDFASPPFSLFRLVDLDTKAFVSAWSTVEHKASCCAACVDMPFTAGLLQAYAGVAAMTLQDQGVVRAEVQALLNDVAMSTPLSSDSVELKNGQTQWVIGKRGSTSVRGPHAAAQLSLLQSAVNQHAWVVHEAAKSSLPPKKVEAGILRMAGVRTVATDEAGECPKL